MTAHREQIRALSMVYRSRTPPIELNKALRERVQLFLRDALAQRLALRGHAHRVVGGLDEAGEVEVGLDVGLGLPALRGFGVDVCEERRRREEFGALERGFVWRTRDGNRELRMMGTTYLCIRR